MILNDRKIRILEAIINDYIQTGEPIGSRTIAKKYDLGISSATIRNEMSDLEEMGFITQRHASSGRVPSDKGYRLYVDRMMPKRELTKEETLLLRKLIANNITQIDTLLQETVRVISILTNCTAIVCEQQISKTRVRNVQLMSLDENTLILVLITTNKAVKNRLINLSKVPDEEMLRRFSNLLNKVLPELSSDEIDFTVAKKLSEKLGGEWEEMAVSVLHAIYDSLLTEDNVQIYTSGVKNILNFPDFSDLEKVKSMFQALEERDLLITLLGNTSSEKIQVLIGTENNMDLLEDCSVIKSNYQAGEHNFGSIGIIGPKRMDYSQAVSVLNGILKHINAVIKALSGR